MKIFKGRLRKIILMLFVFFMGMSTAALLYSLTDGDDTSAGRSPDSSQSDSAKKTWTCSMHPNIKLPKKGKCPICFMDLILLESDSGDDDRDRVIEIGDYAARLMDIETSPVMRRFVSAEVRMSGKVDYDETRVSHIAAWMPGRLDRLYINYTGIPVKKGDHMVEIYSPDLLVAREELLQAKKLQSELKKSGSEVVLRTAASTVKAVREKLRLLGLSEKQIEDLGNGEEKGDHITIYAPVNGIVIDKSANEGMYVKTGTRIYTIADLSQVWIKLDAYESDISWIKYGGSVEFTTEAYPGEVFDGSISFIDPVVTPATRTVKVRVVVDNSRGKLKPGMFVRAVARPNIAAEGHVMNSVLAGKWISPMHPEVIKDEPGKCDVCGMPLVTAESLGYVDNSGANAPLLIPASAALRTGKRAVVYVKFPGRDKPAYEGREVRLGKRVGDFFIVSKGLDEGEQVVTRGAFKLDAELQIRARPSMMSITRESEDEEVAGSVALMEHASKRVLPTVFAEQLKNVLKSYFDIHKALAGDDPVKARKAAGTAKEMLSKVDMNLLKGHAHMLWMQHLKNLNGAFSTLASAEKIELQRENFYSLSQQLLKTVQTFPVPQQKIYQAFCPMAFNNAGAVWLQDSDEILNPYFGAAMLYCGEIKKEIGGPAQQTLCPVMGNPIDKDVYVDYKGMRVYFCCAGCDEKFKKEPETYIDEMRAKGVEPEHLSE